MGDVADALFCKAAQAEDAVIGVAGAQVGRGSETIGGHA